MTRKDFWTYGAILLAINIFGLAAIWTRTGVVNPDAGTESSVAPAISSRAPLPPSEAVRVAGAVSVADVTPDDSGRGGLRDPNATDRIVVTFDGAVVSAEQTGEFLDWDPIDIEPIVDGEWQWSRQDQLELRLERPLAPGNRFTLGVADDFEMRTGVELDGVGKFGFSTRRLALTRWQVGRQSDSHAEVEFDFNQPVDPQSFKVHAVFLDEITEGKLDWTTLSESPSTRIRVRVETPRSHKIRAHLDAALVGRDGSLGMEGDKIVRLGLRGHFHALPCWPVRPGLDAVHTVHLRFSRGLDRMQRAPKIRLEPDVPDARVSLSGSQVKIRGAFQPGQTYRASLASDVLSDDGQAIAAGELFFIEVKNRGKNIRFSHSRGVLGRKGNLLLELEHANLKGVEIEAIRIYENNFVHFLNGGSHRALSGYGRAEVARRLFPLELKRDVARTALLDLGELLKDPGGYIRSRRGFPGNIGRRRKRS